MKGPDDVPPVTPYERYLADGSDMARWTCPRCDSDNASQVYAAQDTPCVCRVCYKAVNVAKDPARIRFQWKYGEFYKVVETKPEN